eukprot:1093752-Amphidinium_carterae.1
MVFAWDGFSVTMSFAVTHLTILAALYFIVELLKWATSLRIQAAAVAGDIEGEVKTIAVMLAPVLEVVFFSVHGLMWLNAVFRDLLHIIWRLFRGMFLAAAVSLSCARILGLLYVCARAIFSTAENTLATWAEDFAYWSASLATAMWGVFVVLVSAILAACKVVKFVLESVNLLILGTDFVVESAKVNMCQGYVEVRRLLIVNMEGKGYQAPCPLWIDEAIVQFTLWRLFGSTGKVLEMTDLTIVDGVDLNFVKGRGLGPSN